MCIFFGVSKCLLFMLSPACVDTIYHCKKLEVDLTQKRSSHAVAVWIYPDPGSRSPPFARV